MIIRGESDTLEFKASMLEPVSSENQKPDLAVKGMKETLKNEIVTTICAFMNSFWENLTCWNRRQWFCVWIREGF